MMIINFNIVVKHNVSYAVGSLLLAGSNFLRDFQIWQILISGLILTATLDHD